MFTRDNIEKSAEDHLKLSLKDPSSYQNVSIEITDTIKKSDDLNLEYNKRKYIILYDWYKKDSISYYTHLSSLGKNEPVMIDMKFEIDSLKNHHYI